jgi:hypothetical protein
MAIIYILGIMDKARRNKKRAAGGGAAGVGDADCTDDRDVGVAEDLLFCSILLMVPNIFA